MTVRFDMLSTCGANPRFFNSSERTVTIESSCPVTAEIVARLVTLSRRSLSGSFFAPAIAGTLCQQSKSHSRFLDAVIISPTVILCDLPGRRLHPSAFVGNRDHPLEIQKISRFFRFPADVLFLAEDLVFPVDLALV